MTYAVRVLTPKEQFYWGLPPMIPDYVPDKILEIEGKWLKQELQDLCVEYWLDPRGDKDLLVRKLLYVGVLDKDGNLTELPIHKERELAKEHLVAPYLIGPPKKFCCRICGECAPAQFLEGGKFFERIEWLREHYKKAHPGMWGRQEGSRVRTQRLIEKITAPPLVAPQTFQKFQGKKFPLGQLMMTRGVADRVETDGNFAGFVLESLGRHANGDWGDLCEEDRKENEYALDKPLRLFSSYEKKGMPKIWIITEADRSVTTTLFPDEY